MKFLIVVPSHNEETIIESSIENLSKISYEKSLFDVVYIADNCSDLTTYFANNKIKQLNLNNFHVYERFAEASDPSGKPHAIQWLLKEQIKDVYNKYDIVSIIDADNFVDDNMLTEINSQFLCSGENVKAIQIYPDSKNYSNFVARGYASAYYITNRFWQLAKSRIGLNTALAGTGMFFRSAFLEENNGFNATSLVEDLELQTKITLSGNQVKWNHNVRIYDEKPTKSKASLIQKTRWAQGHWWVAFNYVDRLQ